MNGKEITNKSGKPGLVGRLEDLSFVFHGL